jgi:hypothetical protein
LFLHRGFDVFLLKPAGIDELDAVMARAPRVTPNQ